MKDKILMCAHYLFTRFGIRCISQDRIASELRISKKTLYKLFQNKEEIIGCVFERSLVRHQSELEQIKITSPNPVKQFITFFRYIYTSYQPYHPLFLEDLYKTHKESWEKYLTYREYLITYIQRMLTQGMQQGLFRSDLESAILASYVVKFLQLPFQNDSQLAFTDQSNSDSAHQKKEAYEQLTNHFIQGILTDTGRAEYSQMWIYPETVFKNAS